MFASFVCLASVLMVSAVSSQRAPTWDECGCQWVTWQAWSKCNKLCYGRRVRERKVRVYERCSAGFEACDGGAGAYDYSDCNKHCTFGTYNPITKSCKCPEGRYGTCCDSVVTCGTPARPTNGDFAVSNGFNYGSVAMYSCNADYNMTGASSMTCTRLYSNSTFGVWSEQTPKCLFAQSCKSGPCENGATCVNGLESYTCICAPGWSGVNCEQDVQPPVVTNCEGDATVHTSDHEASYNWTTPDFSDPLGNDVRTTSNYGQSKFIFPWGDFIVQYVATKPNNGLQKECKFQIGVRPFPCEELPVPASGFVACNGWRSDYGQYCLLGCLSGYSLPHHVDGKQWYVCGASGRWSALADGIVCQENLPGITTTDGILGNPGTCADVTVQQQKYIEELKKSDFNSVCIEHLDGCQPDNVHIRC